MSLFNQRTKRLPRRKWVKRVLLWIGLPILVAAAMLAVSHTVIEATSAPYISNTESGLPSVKVGLVLGTAKYVARGRVNLYYQHRIDAAVRLFNSGKVSHLLISGDNSTMEYNEPMNMKRSLMEAGIPDSSITLDYAGFDTYDSMIRAREVFGQQRFIVVTQEFQARRAVYIARSFGIEAYGLKAADVAEYGGLRTRIREVFARGKAFIEVMLGVKPTYLGEQIIIP